MGGYMTRASPVATGGNGRQQARSRKRRHRDQQEAKATGGNGRQQARSRKRRHQGLAGGKSNGRQREATSTEPKATTQGPILKNQARTPYEPALFGEKQYKHI